MSEISYRYGSPPTKADRRRQKRHSNAGYWIDFALDTVRQIIWTAAITLLIIIPAITGHR